MATDTQPNLQQRYIVAIPSDPIWRLSIEQYHQMARSGILTDDDPVELLEGWLVTKMPKNPAHRLSTQLTRAALDRIVPAGWHINDQEPITTGESEPEPDISLVRGERRQYRERHPMPNEIAMVVEVSDATLQRDQTSKKRIYARAAIPVFWIINLIDRRVEVYTNPTGDADQPDYRSRRDYQPADQIPLLIEARQVGLLLVSDLLP